jgi:hypothetical protein
MPSRCKARATSLRIRHSRDGDHIADRVTGIPIISRHDLNLPPQRRDQTVTAGA